jgi:hypothetical protein
MSKLSDIADAVVVALNAAPALSMSFTATKEQVIEYDIAKVAGALKVFVFALGEVIDLSSRTQLDHQYTIKTAIYKQLATDPATGKVDATEFAAVDQLREEVVDRLWANASQAAGAYAITVANEPVYDPVQLDKYKTFVSVVTLTYELPR